MLHPSTAHFVAVFAAFEPGALLAALRVRETAKAVSPIPGRIFTEGPDR
jgi:hypothetical protein